MDDNYYGHKDPKTPRYPLAAYIWGHRLRIGQHWIEYLLEFLNVLAGYKYQFGKGLDTEIQANGEISQLEYHRFTRLGLRRFIFYDEREKTRHPFDEQAVKIIRERLSTNVQADNAREVNEVLEQIRALLRSFSAIEEERSWFAKSLFPVHHEFLFWEALREGATKYETHQQADGLDAVALDHNIEFNPRNFFARGGEIYYLIISAGTAADSDRRHRIAKQLRTLLIDRNQTLGRMAQLIDQAWSEWVEGQDDAMNDGHGTKGTLGWILDEQCILYQLIAEDLDTFLNNDLDPLETLELLAHLIGFHIVSYIYHRAHPVRVHEAHNYGSCLEPCRPELLIDMTDAEDGGIIRSQSAMLLRQQEDQQIRQAREFVEQKVCEWANGVTDHDLFTTLGYESEQFFSLGEKKAKAVYTRAISRVESRYTQPPFDRVALISDYSDMLFEALTNEFRKNFLGIHKKIGRSIGLIAPRKGPTARFVLGDNLLKALVLANLPATGGTMRYGDFLRRLYDRYGIIIGPGEAAEAGLIERLRINERYYSLNREAFLLRMISAGLVREYSDATALVYRG